MSKVVDGNNDFWKSFGDSSLFIEVVCDFTGSLASDVLSFYGIACNTSDIGGALDGVDIKSMDAMQVIKLSLLEYTAGSTNDLTAVYEPVVYFSENQISFKPIGTYAGFKSGLKIYHSVQSYTFTESCAGVMITGRKPLPYRKSDTEWKPIWAEYREIFDTTDMISNCNRPNFSRQATIVFRDPHLNSDFEDGIDNFYEIDRDNPWDSIMGYAIQKNSKSVYMEPSVTINEANSCSVPIRLTGIATNPHKEFEGVFYPDIKALARRPTFQDGTYSEECYTDYAQTPGDIRSGIKVPIPEKLRFKTKYGVDIDSFTGISSVFVIGKPIIRCYAKPKSDEAAMRAYLNKSSIAPEDCQIWVHIEKPNSQALMLSEGEHYVIGYDEADPSGFIQPYVILANGARDFDKANYGTGARYRLFPYCKGATGVTNIESEKVGTILPINGTAGILVEDVYAVVDLGSNCIIINDPKGHADDIAKNFEYNLLPLIMVDEPAPIAFNGVLIDQSQRQDHDPTTVQEFEETDYEKAVRTMDNGTGISLNLSFLNSDQCVKLSSVLYDYLNAQDVTETVYTCDPECEVSIGGYGLAGGIINSISYQYSDSSSYTISVTEGPRLIGGFTDFTGGPYVKKTETVSAVGTVIQDLGNHIFFKVILDGLGVVYAINTCSDIIRSGDKVQCTIHNNPVEA